MTQLLIRLFIRHPDNPQDPHTRAAYGNLASIVGMVCNVLLCLGKLAVGTLFGSIAIMPMPEQPVGCIVQYCQSSGVQAGVQSTGRGTPLRPCPV